MTQMYQNFNQVKQAIADIEAIDYFFAKELLFSLSAEQPLPQAEEQFIMHLGLALSVSLRNGNTCLPLDAIANSHWAYTVDENGQTAHVGFKFPDKIAMSSLLTKLDLTAKANKLIVHSLDNIYIRRYFQFESELVESIQQRINTKSLFLPEQISEIVRQLFPAVASESHLDDEKELDWQKIAVANAINKNFAVIAGGPGTGKTYTVTKLLAAMLMLRNLTSDKNVQGANKFDIALVAPTGKAAQRLSESIIKAIAGFKGLIADSVLADMPTQASTIHRLLGVIPNSPNFKHNGDNLLSCDVLLVDEVSMVDLPMMTRLFRALKPECKIILLGDADQLPSVAVGCVLADIAPRPHRGFSEDNLHYLAQICAISAKQLQNTLTQCNTITANNSDHLSLLVKSRRFDGEGGIGVLANHVIKGKANASWDLLAASIVKEASANRLSTTEKKLNQLSLASNNLQAWLAPLVEKYYQGLSQCNSIEQAFRLLAKFRVLCVTRQGEFGVDAVNNLIREQVTGKVSSQHTQGQNLTYHGMPIMISVNDYRLGLFNGDIGLLWRTDDGHLMAFFETVQQEQSDTLSYRMFLPSRLPRYDSVYAMTIHKTQGSEFEHVAMVLPKQSEHQLLSRELLYTGITRAKRHLTIASNKSTWKFAVNSAMKRHSGLML